jgi:hypothetical protein
MSGDFRGKKGTKCDDVCPNCGAAFCYFLADGGGQFWQDWDEPGTHPRSDGTYLSVNISGIYGNSRYSIISGLIPDSLEVFIDGIQMTNLLGSGLDEAVILAQTMIEQDVPRKVRLLQQGLNEYDEWLQAGSSDAEASTE